MHIYIYVYIHLYVHKLKHASALLIVVPWMGDGGYERDMHRHYWQMLLKAKSSLP